MGWDLLSPDGAIFSAQCLAELDDLADRAHVPRHHLKQLVELDPLIKKTAYRSQWQLLSRAVQMQRVDGGSNDIITVAGDAEHFIRYHAGKREDTEHFKLIVPSRFQSFLNGNLKNSGAKTKVFRSRGIQFEWRLMETPPANQACLISPNHDPATPSTPPLCVHAGEKHVRARLGRELASLREFGGEAFSGRFCTHSSLATAAFQVSTKSAHAVAIGAR